MASTEGTPVERLRGLSKDVLKALKASWITTAEQLLASTAAIGGADQMAENLGISKSELEQALTVAEAAVPASERRRLKTPTDTSDLGLGARPPDADE
jgi:hypothetical protein